jgi:hypothetical protein
VLAGAVEQRAASWARRVQRNSSWLVSLADLTA